MLHNAPSLDLSSIVLFWKKSRKIDHVNWIDIELIWNLIFPKLILKFTTILYYWYLKHNHYLHCNQIYNLAIYAHCYLNLISLFKFDIVIWTNSLFKLNVINDLIKPTSLIKLDDYFSLNSMRYF